MQKPTNTAHRQAVEAIKANALEPDCTVFIINGDHSIAAHQEFAGIVRDQCSLLSGIKASMTVFCEQPPHQTIDARAWGVQGAIETCATEWMVIVDFAIERSAVLGQIDEAGKALRNMEALTYGGKPAYSGSGSVVFAKTLPMRTAFNQVPMNRIRQWLKDRGWGVYGKNDEADKRVAVLTLMGAANRVEPWFMYMQKSDIPPNAKIVIGDNSGSPECATLIFSAARNLRSQFHSVEIINLGEPYKREEGEVYIHPGKHIHVADLYNQVLPNLLPQCDEILFIEHDVIAPLDGFAKLSALLRRDEAIAVAAGCYEQPESKRLACAARGTDRWTGIVELDKLKPTDAPFKIGMTGGGFTLYRSKVLLDHCLPFRPTFWPDPYLLGWDGTVGRDLFAAGFQTWIHPGVMCKHEYTSVNQPKPEK